MGRVAELEAEAEGLNEEIATARSDLVTQREAAAAEAERLSCAHEVAVSALEARRREEADAAEQRQAENDMAHAQVGIKLTTSTTTFPLERERERRFRVYEMAPGFCPGLRTFPLASHFSSCLTLKVIVDIQMFFKPVMLHDRIVREALGLRPSTRWSARPV